MKFQNALKAACLTALCAVTSIAHAVPITAVDFLSDSLITFDSATPNTQNVINAGGVTDALYGIDFDPSATTLYALENGGKTYGTIDTATGTYSSLGSLTGISLGHTLSGLSVNPLTGAWYVSSTNASASSLYTLDLGTGALSLVGTQSTAPAIIDIAIDSVGTIFATDLINDSLYRLDATSGAATLVGALGIDLNFAQGMDFDYESGTLFAAIQGSGITGQFGTINTTTGAYSSIATFSPDRDMEIAVSNAFGVPEPASVALVGLALTGLGFSRRKAR